MSASTTGFAGSWKSLPTSLTPWIMDVIQSMGYDQMTPVQAATIPLFMKNKDVVVEAVTGSGKTLAFVIPILERLIRRESKLKRNEVGALVISPTRELATQIHSVFSLFLSSQPRTVDSSSEAGSPPPEDQEYPSPLLLVSSSQSSPAQDIQRFLSTGADIIIGTPGRVEEFLLGKGRSSVSVKELEVLVLDEADRLLDLGFQTQVTRILVHLPKQRRTGLFSATMTDADALSELVRVGLRNPARVVVKVQSKKVMHGPEGKNKRSTELVEERRIPANLENFYLRSRPSEKVVQIGRIIQHEVRTHASAQFIIYFSTCACVDYFYKILPSVLPLSASLYSLHGNLPPSARTRTLSAFVSSAATPDSPAVLLATDVAARGLDLPHVDVVIQFDPPSDPKAFSHRCGRTARAGRSGRAWVLLCGRETEYVDFMSIRKIPMKESPAFEADDSERPDVPEVAKNLEAVRSLLLNDRALHDQATKAFVSFIRAYSKHEASYIFRLSDLDLTGVAKCFGLLRLPKMPELKDVDRSDWQDAEVDWNSFAYADKAQEAKRIASQAEKKAGSEQAKINRSQLKKQNASWSRQANRKEERDKRREKKVRKRKWLNAQASASKEGEGSEISDKAGGEISGDGEDDGEDWEELAREERMAKKVKRGVVSQTAFDAEFGDL